MLGSYATRDHYQKLIKQRRLVSRFPRLPSGTALAGWMTFASAALRQSAIAEGNADAIVSLLERR